MRPRPPRTTRVPYTTLFRSYDGEGNLQNRITEGYFMVGDIAAIDTTAQTIYFEGYGNEEEVNPFYSHHYKVRFDGSRQQLLTPEEANHSISMRSEERRVGKECRSRWALYQYSKTV